MKISKYANGFLLSGSALVISSLVFIFYFIAILLQFQYTDAKSIFTILLANNCMSNRLLNASFDFQQCVQNGNSFVLSSYPPYAQVLLTYFDLTSPFTYLFFSPLILGVVLVLIGFFAKRVKK